MRRRSSRMPSAIDTAMCQRMGAPRFAEAADQRVVAGFAENQSDGMLAAQPAIHLRQVFDLLAFARVHEQARRARFRRGRFRIAR